jgi:hypothetical protein
MTLGLDFYDTITSNIPRFRDLAKTILDGGGRVVIITAVTPSNEKRVRLEISRSRIPFTEVEVVLYGKYSEIPKLKLEKCRLHKVDIMIDDHPNTCKCLSKYGYTALSVTPKGTK